jgi:hypothetical protein
VLVGLGVGAAAILASYMGGGIYALLGSKRARRMLNEYLDKLRVLRGLLLKTNEQLHDVQGKEVEGALVASVEDGDESLESKREIAEVLLEQLKKLKATSIELEEKLTRFWANKQAACGCSRIISLPSQGSVFTL